MTKATLILLPGLGADREVFRPQLDSDELSEFDLIVPDWLPVETGESLESYAKRLAEGVAVEKRPCFVAGLSFGGMLAPYVAEAVGAAGCLLVATIRCGNELPWYYRMLRPLRSILPSAVWEIPKTAARMHHAVRGHRFSENRLSIYKQLFRCPSVRLHEFSRMCVNWRGPARDFDFPIFHIHGTNDRVLPLRFTEADELLLGAGHCLTLTRPDDINAFLRRSVAACGR